MKLSSIRIVSVLIAAMVGDRLSDAVCAARVTQEADSPKVVLRPQLRPGLELFFKHQTKVDQLLTGPRIRQRILADATMYVRIRVVSVASDGYAQVELVHHRITSDTSTEPAQFAREQYDSANPKRARGDAALAFQPVIGKPIALRVGPSGDTKVISGVAGLKVPRRARSLFDQCFSDAAIESTYADLFQVATAVDGIPIGGSWSLTRHQPDEIGKKVLQLNLTLSKLDGSNAVIEETGQTKVEIKTGPGIPKVRLVASSIRGRWIWDLSTGTLRSLTRTEKEKLKIHTLDNVDLESTVTRITEISRDESGVAGSQTPKAIAHKRPEVGRKGLVDYKPMAKSVEAMRVFVGDADGSPDAFASHDLGDLVKGRIEVLRVEPANRVKDRSFAQVRILDGPHKGEIVWLSFYDSGRNVRWD